MIFPMAIRPWKVVPFLLCCVLATQPVCADGTDPVVLDVHRSVRGRIIPMNDTSKSLVLLTQRPAWSGSVAAVKILNAAGDAQQEGFVGKDVRDCIPFRNGLLVAEVEVNAVSVTFVDKTLARTSTGVTLTMINMDQHPSAPVELLGIVGAKSVVVRIADVVAVLRISDTVMSAEVIERNVSAATVLRGTGGRSVALAYSIGPSTFLTTYDSTFRAISTVAVPSSEVARIESVGPYVVLISASEGAAGSILSIVDPTSTVVGTRTAPVPASLLTLGWRNNILHLGMIVSRRGRFEIVSITSDETSEELPQGLPVEGDMGKALCLKHSGDTLYAVFSGGVMLANVDGEQLCRSVFPVELAGSIAVSRVNRSLVLSGQNGSLILALSGQPFWWFYRAVDAVVRYVVPLVLLALAALAWVLYRRQRRFFDAVIDIPGAGLVFVLDANGRLLRTNERAATLLRITRNVPMRRLYMAYMQQGGLQQLTAFLSRVQSSRSGISDRVVIEEAEEQREYMCTSIPLVGLLGRSAGTIITGVDITEALERRRLVNWAQLAHDMQTNLSTIRLNAEQLEVVGDPKAIERRRRILFQVGVLIQRVRDLVSVGRSEDVTRLPVHSAELCTEIRHEFDPTMFPHVSFQMKLRGTMMNVDRLKLSRAIRNAVENSIKSLRGQPGTVEIATWFDRANVFIRVSDTGVGMDAETLSNMMKPYFTTAKDGTGTGIGTMIMQHVMNLHGGSLRVTSEPGVGTQVIFRIPIEVAE